MTGDLHVDGTFTLRRSATDVGDDPYIDLDIDELAQVRRLRPKDGLVFAVRWQAPSGALRHRLFLQRAAADRYAAEIAERGLQVAVYEDRVTWTLVTPDCDD